MEKINKLVRDRVSGVLASKGYNVVTKKLNDEQRKNGLYSLFLREFKECEETGNASKRITHCADMLQILDTLFEGESLHEHTRNKQDHPLKWYEKLASERERVKKSKTNLLSKFYELLTIENNEVFQDQLKEVSNAVKDWIESINLDFDRVVQVCKDRLAKLGGFNQGVYLEGVEASSRVEEGL